MIDMQILDGVLLAMAVLVGAAVVLSLAMLASAKVAKPSQPPHGGNRRDLPEHPQPDTDDAARKAIDEARELVLV
jgi:hypothetical protein